ncbi:hypothetical protein Tco_0975998 [Tanacetum coccineum]|uniref:Uncharacterized protein n=1 Tax=Tanacetum coccineum TaxID=301880 RepID=A0ABQ5EG60_9ASTR
MVACLEKSEGNADFHEIVDFLTASSVHCSLTITLAEPFNNVYQIPAHTNKVFTNMKRKGKDFLGRVTLLFASMLAPLVVEGEGSSQPSELQPAPSTAQPRIEEQIPTSVPIPNVDDEAVFKEWDDRVVRATTTAASLDVPQASGNISKTQSTVMSNDPLSQEIGTGGSPSIAGATVTTAGAFISTASPLRVSTAKDISTTKTLVYIRRSAAKDKGKAKMDKSKPEQTKIKLQQRQERAGYESANLSTREKTYFAQQRAEERRNKPLTQAQQRTYMSNYIKHMGSHTLQQLKRLSFDELKNLFEATMRRVGAFVPMETEIRKEVPELEAGSSKRDAEEELDQGSSKRQNTSENSEPAEESKEEKDDELSQEELH